MCVHRLCAHSTRGGILFWAQTGHWPPTTYYYLWGVALVGSDPLTYCARCWESNIMGAYRGSGPAAGNGMGTATSTPSRTGRGPQRN